ncbi:hypothetical protein EVJ58_g6161 [Rhodofomes roseus]|uniref:Uncharacterized protein n=1 Tax=Rhodofomes roseus TaxID=34475 RepID=A0A4Y9Y8I6_9APHY|nr:hypothetical protein EVJ58_g6161 [Rhodofomes roseus]
MSLDGYDGDATELMETYDFLMKYIVIGMSVPWAQLYSKAEVVATWRRRGRYGEVMSLAPIRAQYMYVLRLCLLDRRVDTDINRVASQGPLATYHWRGVLEPDDSAGREAHQAAVVGHGRAGEV